MATKPGRSNGPDWRDIAEMVSAFEEQNRVLIEVSMLSSMMHEEPDLSVSGKAWERGVDRREAKPLASASVKCRAERVRSLEGVVTYLLYQLDFLLAEHEWTRNPDNEAKPPRT